MDGRGGGGGGELADGQVIRRCVEVRRYKSCLLKMQIGLQKKTSSLVGQFSMLALLYPSKLLHFTPL